MNSWLSSLRLVLHCVISVVIVGCSSNPTTVLVSAIGPSPSAPINGALSDGQLQVYTATEGHDEDAVYYYPHSAYTIFGANGEKVRYVRNHIDRYDETPQIVSLAPGAYTVRGRADGYGYITVPVIVKSGRRTSVYLNRTRRPVLSQAEERLLVRLPDGRAVGWRATSAHHDKAL